MGPSSASDPIAAALDVLGTRRLVLSIHDASFPSSAEEDTGRGSPYSQGGRAFLSFVRALGFDGVQLGPQGQTSLGNASPYDGSVFSKNLMSIALSELTEPEWGACLSVEEIARWVEATPGGGDRVAYEAAFVAQRDAVLTASERLRRAAAEGDAPARAVVARVAESAAALAWLEHDALFEALSVEHGTDDWRRWPERDRALLAPGAGAEAEERRREIEARRADLIEGWRFAQVVLAAQHEALRRHTRALGLTLYGDMQVGLSLRDTWSRAHLFLPGYWMGAPPSRTNPEGQPWGYAVLDPRGYQPRFSGDGGAGRVFLEARFGKVFADYDGVRVDHPHGLVCPWVYDASEPDPIAAVGRGARLFESPEREDHPALAALAIAREDQIDRSVPPYDDRRVRDLTPAQIDAYASVFDLLVETAARTGRTSDDVLCEVLSTCPAPLMRVLERHRLGRFRVTQKASMVHPHDVYRSENAARADWIMVGNHDTPPLARVVDSWHEADVVGPRAAYLAERLEPDASRRAAFAAALAGDRRKLAHAMFADLFASPAEHVMVFFADLYGERAIYNRPGVVHPDNWRLRVPRDFAGVYEERRARGQALCLASALAMALRARGAETVRAHADLLSALEARAAVRV